MMRFFHTFLLLFCIAFMANAQSAKYVYINIGTKQIVLQEKDAMWITRTVKDTVVGSTKKGAKNLGLGTQSFSMQVSPDELKNGVREFYIDSATGITWTRFISDEVYTSPEKKLVCVNDSETVVHTANPRVDTIMQINPITLEEQMYVEVDSSIPVKYDLGKIKKADFVTALQDQFGASLKNYALTEIGLDIVDKAGAKFIIDFRDNGSLKAGVEAINRSRSNTKVMLAYVQFNPVSPKLPTLSLSYLAVFTLVD